MNQDEVWLNRCLEVLELSPLWRRRVEKVEEDEIGGFPSQPVKLSEPRAAASHATATVVHGGGIASKETRSNAAKKAREEVKPGASGVFGKESPGLQPVEGIPAQHVSAPPPVLPPEQNAPPPAAPMHERDLQDADWDKLKTLVRQCKACPLWEGRKQTVVGVGDVNARWLFVGEAPGAEEDRRGEPFVGQAGKLLDAMLAAMHLKRGEDVYIANVLKCRPPKNRDPLGLEVKECEPFLKRQIELIEPKVIVALGRFAVQSLLHDSAPLSELRGREHHYQGVPLIVTYHPAYLLRSPLQKRQAWKDLKFAMSVAAKCGVHSAVQ